MKKHILLIRRTKVSEPNTLSPMRTGNIGEKIRVFYNLDNETGLGCGVRFKKIDGSYVNVILYNEEFEIVR
jgi:hypothetical protein